MHVVGIAVGLLGWEGYPSHVTLDGLDAQEGMGCEFRFLSWFWPWGTWLLSLVWFQHLVPVILPLCGSLCLYLQTWCMKKTLLPFSRPRRQLILYQSLMTVICAMQTQLKSLCMRSLWCDRTSDNADLGCVPWCCPCGCWFSFSLPLNDVTHFCQVVSKDGN